MLADRTHMLQAKWFWAIALVLGCAACGGQSDADGNAGSAGAAGSSGSGGSGGSGATGGSGGSGATGGSSAGAGGSGATGGSSGAGAAGGSVGAPECTQDSECKLFSDCCTCMAYGPNEAPPPSCFADCTIDMCGMLAVKAPSCQAGRCVAGFDCDQTHAFCNALPPTCGPGTVPSVVNGCWGSCVAVDQCMSAPSCADCTASQICAVIEEQATGPVPHCVDVAQGCENNPTCECMGPSVCLPPYATCTDFSGIKGVSCSCPNC